ncbi:MAG: oxidoreductase, partial [Nocardioides sp.]|nr:oxidoreductase [Nocardioides sp.]
MAPRPTLEQRALVWPLAGLVAGAAGLLTSYAAAMVLTIRETPVVAIAELVVRSTPGPVVAFALKFLGAWNKTLLLSVMAVLTVVLFWYVGAWARRRWWVPVLVYSLMATLAAVAVLLSADWSGVDLLPVAVGYVTWLVVLSLLTEPLRRADAVAGEGDASGSTGAAAYSRGRRQFLVRAGLLGAAAVAAGMAGRVVGSG